MDQKTVRELFEYRNGVLYWRKKPANSVNITKPAGSIGSSGYLSIGIKYKLYLTHRLIFLYHHGYIPKTLDHINNNKLDNRIENLRPATNSENIQNSKKSSINVSGYKGVSFHKNVKKWCAQIRINKKLKYLGCFSTPEEAHQAYCQAADKHFGEFANHGV